MEPNLQAAIQKIDEAKRVGKCPWCCCAITEQYVYETLNPIIGVLVNGILVKVGNPELYPQETFEESQKRWFKEGKIKRIPKL